MPVHLNCLNCKNICANTANEFTSIHLPENYSAVRDFLLKHGLCIHQVDTVHAQRLFIGKYESGAQVQNIQMEHTYVSHRAS